MNPFSPIAHAFRLVLRRPSVALGEIAWRWSFAATAWVLGGAFIFEYLDSLPVSQVEQVLLSTGHPFLVSRALRHVFHGSLFRFTEAAILTGIGITIAWILIASLGRLVVVRSVLNELGIEYESRTGAFGTLCSLNFLRAAALLAAKLSALGTILGASSVWASTHIRVADAIRIAFLFWFLITVTWLVLNWLLSTATVFAGAGSGTTRESIAEVLGALQRSPGPMLATVVLFGMLQAFGLAAVGGASFALLITVHNAAALLFFEFTLLLIYSAISDFLHAAAIVAYVRIWNGEEPVPVTLSPSNLAPRDIGAIDQDELILSDAPLPAI